jgi:hypothetical protein
MDNVGQFLATQGAKAAAESIGAGAGALAGAEIGTAIVPIIGSALGALAGWLVSEFTTLFFANCDGPVAAEQVVFTGAQLSAKTANGVDFTHATFHPGTDSPGGCGSNSEYWVGWSIYNSATPPVVPRVVGPRSGPPER